MVEFTKEELEIIIGALGNGVLVVKGMIATGQLDKEFVEQAQLDIPLFESVISKCKKALK